MGSLLAFTGLLHREAWPHPASQLGTLALSIPWTHSLSMGSNTIGVKQCPSCSPWQSLLLPIPFYCHVFFHVTEKLNLPFVSPAVSCSVSCLSQGQLRQDKILVGFCIQSQHFTFIQLWSRNRSVGSGDVVICHFRISHLMCRVLLSPIRMAPISCLVQIKQVNRLGYNCSLAQSMTNSQNTLLRSCWTVFF